MKQPIWHNIEIDEVLTLLGASEMGLTSAEALARLKKYGPNELPKEKRLTRLKIFLEQFKSPLIYILLIAATITFILGDYIDMGVIIATVLLNTIIGFFEENKAEKTIESLKLILENKAKVLRNGQETIIDAEELAIGDILLIEAGDKIMADARILATKNLQADEAVLTGESIPSAKFAKVLDKGIGLAERKNMLYMGTNIIRGRGRAVVTAIGSQTELGEIAKALREIKEEKTPLQQQLVKFGQRLALGFFVISLILFVVGLWQGRSIFEMFLLVSAVAVASVPEGLAISLTIILAAGMQKILKEKALVRKLIAAETLGSVSIICTDKTGTLTLGKMLVDHIITETESEETKIKALEIGLLCNNAFIENPNNELKDWKLSGDSLEQTLLLAAIQAGLDREELNGKMIRLDEIPFDEGSKYMAILIKNSKSKNQNLIYVKGAPEKILEMSNKLDIDGHQEEFSREKKEKFERELKDLAGKGLRLLAVAYKEAGNLAVIASEDINNLVFVGLIALKDPLRVEAKEAIQLCEKSGIRPILVTGDHRLTARAIALEIGLLKKDDNDIMEGQELDKLSDKEFAESVNNIRVYARVEPRHKLRIIEAWQKRGEVVAMTGDGVNDAPALKKADVGVALGSGTEVAKGASDIILLDDNFKTIIRAVEEGRTIFENLRKVLLYFFSDGFCEVMLVGISLFLGLPLPVLAAQILWVNFIEHSTPAMALALESDERELLLDKPRKKSASIFNLEMNVIIFLKGTLTVLILYALFYFSWKTTDNIVYARSMIFAGLAVFPLFSAWSFKSLHSNIWEKNPFKNKFFNYAMLFSFFMLAIAFYIPFLQEILRTVPLTVNDWAMLVGLGMANIVLVEIIKYFFKDKKST